MDYARNRADRVECVHRVHQKTCSYKYAHYLDDNRRGRCQWTYAFAAANVAMCMMDIFGHFIFVVAVLTALFM